jgi:[protein-PII] uridylyltransferase
VPPEAEELVREIVYPLWDMGLEVSHATRSVNECLRLARQDYEVLTSLLDGRFICGMSPLFHKLMERLRGKFIAARSSRIIDWLIDSNRMRHARFGDSAYLLEPNLKEGQGGLRDYHTMLWIARISRISSRRGIWSITATCRITNTGRSPRHSILSGRCATSCTCCWGENAINCIWNTRPGWPRPCTSRGLNGLLPVEKLLGDLHGRMEFIKQTYRVFIYEMEQKKRLKRKNKHLKAHPGGRASNSTAAC